MRYHAQSLQSFTRIPDHIGSRQTVLALNWLHAIRKNRIHCFGDDLPRHAINTIRRRKNCGIRISSGRRYIAGRHSHIGCRHSRGRQRGDIRR